MTFLSFSQVFLGKRIKQGLVKLQIISKLFLKIITNISMEYTGDMLYYSLISLDVIDRFNQSNILK